MIREFKFSNSKQVHYGVPVIASNMDTVGTFEMAKALAEHKCYTCVHKYYSVEDWKEFAASNKAVLPYVAASSGTAEGDFERLCDILESIPEVSGGGLTTSKGLPIFFLGQIFRFVQASGLILLFRKFNDIVC